MGFDRQQLDGSWAGPHQIDFACLTQTVAAPFHYIWTLSSIMLDCRRDRRGCDQSLSGTNGAIGVTTLNSDRIIQMNQTALKELVGLAPT